MKFLDHRRAAQRDALMCIPKRLYDGAEDVRFFVGEFEFLCGGDVVRGHKVEEFQVGDGVARGVGLFAVRALGAG